MPPSKHPAKLLAGDWLGQSPAEPVNPMVWAEAKRLAGDRVIRIADANKVYITNKVAGTPLEQRR